MKIRLGFPPVALVLFAATAHAESPALQGSSPRVQGVGKPGSGRPASLGQITLKSEPETKAQTRSIETTNTSIVQVQRILKERGFYRGPVDGDAGKGTLEAVRNFKKEKGLPLTANIDRPLLDALGL